MQSNTTPSSNKSSIAKPNLNIPDQHRDENTTISVTVHFGKVQIREYPRILGDNPSCATHGGPPISIGWSYITTSPSLSLEEYEVNRPKRRNLDQLRMPPKVRRTVLQSNGFTSQEMLVVTKNASYVLSCRRSSYAMVECEHIQLLIECTMCWLRKRICRRSHNNKK